MQANSEMLNYIATLPKVRQKLYEEAEPRWDSGVTSEMVQASYDLIQILEQILVRLASCYPERHFGEHGAADYMNSVIASRFLWHRAHLEPHGAGKHGTMIGPMVCGYVIADVEEMIKDMVFSLTVLPMLDFDYKQWERRWKQPLEGQNKPPIMRISLSGVGSDTLLTDLDGAGIKYVHRLPEPGQMMNAGELVEIAKVAVPAIATVLVAWISARASRKVTITLPDKKIVQVEGRSVQEVEHLLTLAQSVMVMETKKPDSPKT